MPEFYRRRIEELFHRALALPSSAREELLAKQHEIEPAVALEVQSLLEALSNEQPVAWAGEDARSHGARRGDRLGAYELVCELASGGMGTVWRARRVDGSFEREVAVKLIQATADSRSERSDREARFQVERRILAALEHPHIARLLDGGTSAAGQPYLVMELVEGQPIDTYVETAGLTRRQCLELYCKVGGAVEYAHRHLVAHRDIKPSNVLVSGTAGAADPKLLDFGIARLLSPAAGGELLATRTREGSRLTPAYASPEQLQGRAVGVATDVYSLGVLLYRLLLGRLPYELEGGSPHELLQAVCERPPLAPRRLDPSLPVELETILLKALEKAPEQRYPSVRELVQDIELHLAGFPVRARRCPAALRFWKLVCRQKLASTLLATLLLVLLGSCAWLVQLYRATRRASEQAAQRATQAETTSSLFVEIFGSSNPFTASGRTRTVIAALDEGLPRLAARLADQPLVLARIRSMAGTVYHSLGAYESSERELRAALSGFGQAVEARMEMEESSVQLATVLADLGRGAEAEELLEPLEARLADPASLASELAPRAALVLGSLAFDRGLLERAAKQYERAAKGYARTRGPRDPRVLEALAFRAQALSGSGRAEEADQLLAATLAQQTEVLGKQHPSTLESKMRLADIRMHAGRIREAIPMLEGCVEGLRSTLGEEHKVTLTAQASLAAAYGLDRQDDLADALFRDTVPALQRQLGPIHQETLKALQDQAGCLLLAGRASEAWEIYEHVLASRESGLGLADPASLTGLRDYCTSLIAAGELGRARSWLERCRADLRAHGVLDPVAYDLRAQLGVVLALQGSRPELLTVLEELERDLAPRTEEWSTRALDSLRSRIEGLEAAAR